MKTASLFLALLLGLLFVAPAEARGRRGQQIAIGGGGIAIQQRGGFFGGRSQQVVIGGGGLGFGFGAVPLGFGLGGCGGGVAIQQRGGFFGGRQQIIAGGGSGGSFFLQQ